MVMAGSKSMIFPSPGIAGGEVSVQDAADRGSRGRATADTSLWRFLQSMFQNTPVTEEQNTGGLDDFQ